MKFIIKHEMKGRIRVHLSMSRMTFREADILCYYLTSQENITSAKVYEKTADAVICYQGDRAEALAILKRFCFDEKNRFPRKEEIRRSSFK